MLSISTMLGAAINIIMNFLLIPSIGAMGAAIATAFSYFVMWIIRMQNTRHIMELLYSAKRGLILVSLLLIEVVLASVDTITTHAGAYCILVIILLLNKNMAFEMLHMVKAMLLSRINKRKEENR